MHFLAESIAMNSDSKLNFFKYRRHSSQTTNNAFAKPHLLKIGEATALPIMLYQQWIHMQEPTQSDATDDTKGSDDEQKIHNWTANKMSCEDASLHISR